MAVYKDKKRGTWYTSFLYVDWTGKRCRKLKRGFLTKKAAQNWENHFKLQKANSLDMTFEDFYGIYEADVKPKIRYNTWCTKEHIIKTKILLYFKDLSMRDITPRDIIKWQNTMRESINNKGKEYTGTYLKTVQAQLSSIFNHAVRFYELPNNPVRVAGSMGQNESDEMGKQKKKIVNREFHSFRPAYVFDVQQTSGEPLPTLATMLEESVEGYEQLKEALILISPVQVSFESIEGSANGYYSPAEEKIVVREGMPQLQTIKTLIHEIGHVELKHGSEEDKFDRNTKEIQAESVAFWVAEMIGNGLDTSEYSFGYISGWSKDKTVPELKENLDLML